MREFISHANDRTNDARSSTFLYGSPNCQSGDKKSSVPTLICNTPSELSTKQLISKSVKCNSLLTTSMLSGLTSLCNTPVMCKPVTACKSSVRCTCGDTSPDTHVVTQQLAQSRLPIHDYTTYILLYLKCIAPKSTQRARRDGWQPLAKVPQLQKAPANTCSLYRAKHFKVALDNE